MRVSLHIRQRGAHRAYIDVHWYRWALPLSVSISTSFFPREQSITDDLSTWDCQRVLNISVLCLTLRTVLVGPLFTDEEIE